MSYNVIVSYEHLNSEETPSQEWLNASHTHISHAAETETGSTTRWCGFLTPTHTLQSLSYNPKQKTLWEHTHK